MASMLALKGSRAVLVSADSEESCPTSSVAELKEKIENLKKNLINIPDTNQETTYAIEVAMSDVDGRIDSRIYRLGKINNEIKDVRNDIAEETNSFLKKQKESYLDDLLKKQKKYSRELDSLNGLKVDLSKQLQNIKEIDPNAEPFRRKILRELLARREAELLEAQTDLAEKCLAKSSGKNIAKKAAGKAAEEVTEGLGKRISMGCLRNARKILGLLAASVTAADFLRESPEERVKFTIAAFEESCSKQKSGRPTSFADQVLNVEAALLPFFETHTVLGTRIRESTDFGFGGEMDQKELEQRLLKLATDCPDLYEELGNLRTFHNDTQALYPNLKWPTEKQLDLFRKKQAERQRQEDLRRLRTIPGF